MCVCVYYFARLRALFGHRCRLCAAAADVVVVCFVYFAFGCVFSLLSRIGVSLCLCMPFIRFI